MKSCLGHHVYIGQGVNARKENCSCAHIETSSLWAEFVNKNRCISVRLESVEDKKHVILIILIIQHNSVL